MLFRSAVYQKRREARSTMSREISLLLAGDALLTRPWSHVRDADFIGLIEEIRDADVAIANLETVIHEFKGHVQADSGGTYMASPPRIATELKWAGFGHRRRPTSGADLGRRPLSSLTDCQPASSSLRRCGAGTVGRDARKSE